MLGAPPRTSYASISQPPSARGSPIARTLSSPSQGRRMRPGAQYGVSRSSNSSPLTMGHEAGYYGDELDQRVSHRSRSATRVPPQLRSYQGAEQDFVPIRDRSLERGDLARPRYRDDMYRETAIDGDPYARGYGRDGGSFVAELQTRLNELQSQYGSVKRELDATTQKLGSSMHSIKTFWSPELKKERALRKEEAAKYALINDQLKILRSENQVSTLAEPDSPTPPRVRRLGSLGKIAERPFPWYCFSPRSLLNTAAAVSRTPVSHALYAAPPCFSGMSTSRVWLGRALST